MVLTSYIGKYKTKTGKKKWISTNPFFWGNKWIRISVHTNFRGNTFDDIWPCTRSYSCQAFVFYHMNGNLDLSISVPKPVKCKSKPKCIFFPTLQYVCFSFVCISICVCLFVVILSLSQTSSGFYVSANKSFKNTVGKGDSGDAPRKK